MEDPLTHTHWAWQQKLGPVDKLVLLALADDADGRDWDGNGGPPPLHEIGKRCGLTTVATASIARHLHDLGLVNDDFRVVSV